MSVPEEVGALAELLQGRRIVALTGAGCSTGSGIPDYRGRGTPPRSRPPIQHHEFVRDAAVRQRYWARSHLGWPRIAVATPNSAHDGLAALERGGVLAGLITQLSLKAACHTQFVARPTAFGPLCGSSIPRHLPTCCAAAKRRSGPPAEV